ETPAVLAALAVDSGQWTVDREETLAYAAGSFQGFCPDTFRFLADLADNNTRSWLEGQRTRYRFAVRAPLVELCRALARRYVEPVLRGVRGWDLDTAARSGRALTSVNRNAYGRGR